MSERTYTYQLYRQYPYGTTTLFKEFQAASDTEAKTIAPTLIDEYCYLLCPDGGTTVAWYVARIKYEDYLEWCKAFYWFNSAEIDPEASPLEMIYR